MLKIYKYINHSNNMNFLTKLIPKFPTSLSEITNNPCEFLKTLLILAAVGYLLYFLYNKFLGKDNFTEINDSNDNNEDELDEDDDLLDLDDDLA